MNGKFPTEWIREKGEGSSGKKIRVVWGGPKREATLSVAAECLRGEMKKRCTARNSKRGEINEANLGEECTKEGQRVRKKSLKETRGSLPRED